MIVSCKHHAPAFLLPRRIPKVLLLRGTEVITFNRCVWKHIWLTRYRPWSSVKHDQDFWRNITWTCSKANATVCVRSVDELPAEISLWSGYYIEIKCVYLMAGCSEPWHLIHCSEYPCFVCCQRTREIWRHLQNQGSIFSRLSISASVMNQLSKVSAPVPSALVSRRMTLSSPCQRDFRMEGLTLARRETKVCSAHAGNDIFIKTFDWETKQRDR
jgi:hypothetical protein